MGFEKYKNHNFYQGQFFNNKPHGQGVFHWVATGEIYEGEWFMSCKQGYGVWKGPHGDSYVGEWLNNQVSG